ncbi:MAG: TorD/DmsD family molecular chaperone [Bacillota bacterium]
MVQTCVSPASARIYQRLALIFHQPGAKLYDPTFLAGLREDLAAAGAERLLHLVDEMAEGLRQTPDLTELTVAYCKLFYGPQKMLAAPYESIYLGGGVLMGESTRLVSRRYQEARVQLWEGFKNMPDHVAAELEFLYYTQMRADFAAASGLQRAARLWDRRHREFLTNHLSRWVRRLAEKVIEGSPSRFYSAAARLLAGWVIRNAEALSSHAS